MEPETIVIISAIAAAISAIAALVVAFVCIMQLRSLRIQNREIHDWNRRKITVDMANAIIQGEEYRNIRNDLFEHGFDINDLERTSDQLLPSLNENDTKTVDVLLTRLFNLFECFCVSLHHNILDQVIAKDFLMVFFVSYYKKYRPYLLQRNQRETQAGVYGEFLCYAKKWESEYQNEVSEQAEVYVYRSRRDQKEALGK